MFQGRLYCIAYSHNLTSFIGFQSNPDQNISHTMNTVTLNLAGHECELPLANTAVTSGGQVTLGPISYLDAVISKYRALWLSCFQNEKSTLFSIKCAIFSC